uniref:Uncharacterized protein n=1 Tax=Setaria italica TaxID=4555 RepID=K4APH0_SETIT
MVIRPEQKSTKILLLAIQIKIYEETVNYYKINIHRMV